MVQFHATSKDGKKWPPHYISFLSKVKPYLRIWVSGLGQPPRPQIVKSEYLNLGCSIRCYNTEHGIWDLFRKICTKAKFKPSVQNWMFFGTSFEPSVIFMKVQKKKQTVQRTHCQDISHFRMYQRSVDIRGREIIKDMHMIHCQALRYRIWNLGLG